VLERDLDVVQTVEIQALVGGLLVRPLLDDELPGAGE
jgi:hypothetical protein